MRPAIAAVALLCCVPRLSAEHTVFRGQWELTAVAGVSSSSQPFGNKPIMTGAIARAIRDGGAVLFSASRIPAIGASAPVGDSPAQTMTTLDGGYLHEFPVAAIGGRSFSPFVSGGLGVASVGLYNPESGAGPSFEDHLGLCWNAGGGVRFFESATKSRWGLRLEYRLYRVPYGESDKHWQHRVQAGISFRIGPK